MGVVGGQEGLPVIEHARLTVTERGRENKGREIHVRLRRLRRRVLLPRVLRRLLVVLPLVGERRKATVKNQILSGVYNRFVQTVIRQSFIVIWSASARGKCIFFVRRSKCAVLLHTYTYD